MFDPPAFKVKVEVLMVAGFIALLKVAVTTGVLGQTRVEPAGGVTAITVGGLVGLPGPALAFLSGSPHPATTKAISDARTRLLATINLRMCFSSFFTQ